ncbi:helix-turn-helix domain-containing protein [Actinoplanes xinjiangensis]|uniref:Helix-turn-helix protein n=1 Tax=Actinoplanes xinjiangensis TaxID=512350 RepID=A0A316FVC5_9ACTN|nr:helix-turn-helix transcriptional regulator [Actinoplanes xinjiangensis]PWK52383.1 helix-turn-helix protein [Actinoplanes xinjiangensis]GIF36916.1 transcriptional regulator [Actinoplanes xinjiangensis]
MAVARDDLPAVSRRRVRLALRAARERTGLSQSEVAKKLGWSLSKVQRIELGEVTISPTDLRALLVDIYQLTDQGRIAELAEEARVARRERYWTAPEHRDHLPPGLVQLLQFELAATTIKEYQSTLVPGHLQTPAFAEATLAWYEVTLSEEARRVRRDVRLARRERVIERGGSPEYRLLLDESALWRIIGDMAITADQFEDLVTAAQRPNVHVRVLPMDNGAVMGMFGGFSVLHLGADSADAVLYRESYTRDELVEDPAEVDYHRLVFDRFWDRSLDEAASRALVLARLYDLRAKIARMSGNDQGTEP